MILQALKEYYDRKADLPRIGWETKAIPFLVLIDNKGNFIGFEDTREDHGNKQQAHEYLIPALGEKKGNGIKANLFWENIEYMFGIPVQKENKKPDLDRVAQQHEMFVQRIAAIKGDCETLNVVRCFLKKMDIQRIQQDRSWPDVLNINRNLLLAIAGKGPVTDDPIIRQLVDVSRTTRGLKGRCLITGNEDEIVALEPPIRGVRGANPTGASLVAVNNKVTKGTNAGPAPAFASFMKEQGHNSPIGKIASFAYTTALNHLMHPNSKQKIHSGDATVIFWSAQDTSFELEVPLFFSEPPKDDPDRNTPAVKALYDSIWSGSYIIPDESTRFYVLGLAPNSARIAVRFYHATTVKEIGEHLKQHIDDLAIVYGKTNPALPLQRLLRSIAVLEKDENIPPNLSGDTMRAILNATPYPATLLQAAIRRIRAEQAKKITGKSVPNVTYERAALIKACLNRVLRFNNPTQEKELTMSLDPDNPNIGYRLGRLFATLEKIQQEASPGINATIRDKFYGAASGTPVTVFGNLMRLKNHHLAKLENVGRRVFFEKLLGEIIKEITDFPTHLPLGDQGRFAIGYYHQMQDFFTKKSV